MGKYIIIGETWIYKHTKISKMHEHVKLEISPYIVGYPFTKVYKMSIRIEHMNT